MIPIPRSIMPLLVFLFVTEASTVILSHARLLYLQNSDPFTVESAAADPAVIAPGAPIRMHYKFVRKRYCDTKLNLFAIKDGSMEVVWRQQLLGGATMLGKADVINTFELGTQVGPGCYHLNTITYSVCTEGSHTMAFPTAPFCVE